MGNAWPVNVGNFTYWRFYSLTLAGTWPVFGKPRDKRAVYIPQPLCIVCSMLMSLVSILVHTGKNSTTPLQSVHPLTATGCVNSKYNSITVFDFSFTCFFSDENLLL